MALQLARTIGDAPSYGPERSGGRRRGDFLGPRGMGFSPGEESLDDGVAAQTIEAQPVFGQIKPSRGQVRPRAEHHEEKTWLASAAACKRSARSSVEKETAYEKRRTSFAGMQLRPRPGDFPLRAAPNNRHPGPLALRRGPPPHGTDRQARSVPTKRLDPERRITRRPYWPQRRIASPRTALPD